MHKRPAAPPAPVPKTYTSSEVARSTGASLRQLQWWDEKSIVIPRQDGHKREYSQDQVIQIRKMIQLRNAGVALQRVKKCLELDWDIVHMAHPKKPVVIGRTLVVGR